MLSMDRYLAFIKEAKLIHEHFGLSDHRAKLPQVFMKKQLNGGEIFVNDLILSDEIASKATLHAIFKSLVRDGLLSVKHLDSDERYKVVSLSKSGQMHLDLLNRALTSSVNRKQ